MVNGLLMVLLNVCHIELTELQYYTNSMKRALLLMTESRNLFVLQGRKTKSSVFAQCCT